MNTIQIVGITIAVGVIAYFIYEAYNQTQESFAKEVVRNAMLARPNVLTKGYSELANEAVDPGNFRSYAHVHEPVEQYETGPWGVPREVRTQPKTSYWLPTFGTQMFEQF